MSGPDRGDIPRRPVPNDPLAAPFPQRCLRNRAPVAGIGGTIERQLDRRPVPAGEAYRLHGGIDALRPKHPRDEGDAERRLSREWLRRVGRRIDSSPSDDRHRPVGRVQAERQRIIGILEQEARAA